MMSLTTFISYVLECRDSRDRIIFIPVHVNSGGHMELSMKLSSCEALLNNWR